MKNKEIIKELRSLVESKYIDNIYELELDPNDYLDLCKYIDKLDADTPAEE